MDINVSEEHFDFSFWVDGSYPVDAGRRFLCSVATYLPYTGLQFVASRAENSKSNTNKVLSYKNNDRNVYFKT
jgi:hypothetical protein